MRVPTRRLIVPFIALACAFYLPKLRFPSAAIFTDVLTPERHAAIGALAKLVCLGVGAAFGFACARRIEPKNPSRIAWLLLASWLACFTVGQCVLILYERVLRVAAPLPSVADAAFLAGYVFLVVAQVRFISVYRASGFPIGSTRAHATLAGVAAVVLALLASIVLGPIARADAPLAERAINVAYPVLDFVAVVPALVLLRVALAFRPGKIWTVWDALLAGILFMAVGDVFFAYLSSARTKAIEPVVDLSLLVGYFFVACGTRLQYELLTE